MSSAPWPSYRQIAGGISPLEGVKHDCLSLNALFRRNVQTSFLTPEFSEILNRIWLQLSVSMLTHVLNTLSKIQPVLLRELSARRRQTCSESQFYQIYGSQKPRFLRVLNSDLPNSKNCPRVCYGQRPHQVPARLPRWNPLYTCGKYWSRKL